MASDTLLLATHYQNQTCNSDTAIHSRKASKQQQSLISIRAYGRTI